MRKAYSLGSGYPHCKLVHVSKCQLCGVRIGTSGDRHQAIHKRRTRKRLLNRLKRKTLTRTESTVKDTERGGTEQSGTTGSEPQTASGNQQSNEGVAVPDGMETVADKDGLILYLKPETTEIAVKDKQNGAMWFSNPQDREADAIATGYNKSQLNVQFELTYYDSAGNALKYDNFTHSVESGQFEVEK